MGDLGDKSAGAVHGGEDRHEHSGAGAGMRLSREGTEASPSRTPSAKENATAAGASRRGVVARAQKPFAAATAKSSGERSPIPQSSSPAAGAIAQSVGPLQQRSSGETTADAEPDGDLGTSDSGA